MLDFLGLTSAGVAAISTHLLPWSESALSTGGGIYESNYSVS